MGLRIKGQETAMTLTSPDGNVTAFDHISSMSFTMNTEILEEGYLGTTANDFDEIYNGIEGEVTAHLSTNDYWTFQEAVQDRAERRTPASGRFDLTTQFTYPTGEIARITIEDIHFGPLETNIGGREEYVEISFDFSASRMSRVL